MSNPTAPHADPVPAELRAVVELFSTALAKVSFPEVDAAVLRKHADEVRARARDVEQARAALQTATDALDRRTAELAVVAERGLAYARIYAAAHPDRAELIARLPRLDGRDDAAAAGEPVGPRRGRRKAPRPELPFEDSSDRLDLDGGIGLSASPA